MSSAVDMRAFSYLRETGDVLSLKTASLTLLIYDYSLLLETEIRLVWGAPWKIGKFLYIITRYLPFAGAIMMVYLDSLRFTSLESCKSMSRSVSFVTLFELYTAELILALRVWAIWGRSRKIALLLLLGSLIPAPILALYQFSRLPQYHNDTLPDFYKNIIHGQFGLCPPFLASADPVVELFIYLAAAEFVILILTLYKAIKHAKNGNLASFVLTFFRDGLMYNAVALASTALNIVMRKSAPEAYNSLFLSMQVVLHSILTSRMLLHIREETVDALTTYPSQFSQTLRFASRRSVNDDHDDHYRLSQMATANEGRTWFGEPFESDRM